MLVLKIRKINIMLKLNDKYDLISSKIVVLPLAKHVYLNAGNTNNTYIKERKYIR